MGVIKEVIRFFRPNPLDVMLEKMQRNDKHSLLLVWNRGLGDIALGLYAMVVRIREYVPNANITFVTRADLKDGIQLLDGVEVIVGHQCMRGQPIDLEAVLDAYGKSREDYDLVIENPDPTYWVKWQLGSLVPKLRWCDQWDAYADDFSLDKDTVYMGVHVDTETGHYYGYEKNWPYKYWYELFKRMTEEKGVKIILFGFNQETKFELDGIIDLRGKTQLLEALSIIKNYLTYFVVPDSGLLSIAYYLNVSFPLKAISLWADPRQGILKQNVPSPNVDLIHVPLIGRDEYVGNISVEQVMQTLATMYADEPIT